MTDLKRFAVHAERDPIEAVSDLANRPPWDVDHDSSVPYGSIQWKGTDVCLDFYCECGAHGHVDADFAYYVECGRCHAIFALNCCVRAHRVQIERSEWPVQDRVEPILTELDPSEIIDTDAKESP